MTNGLNFQQNYLAVPAQRPFQQHPRAPLMVSLHWGVFCDVFLCISPVKGMSAGSSKGTVVTTCFTIGGSDHLSDEHSLHDMFHDMFVH
jgi:hypothetical protein